MTASELGIVICLQQFVEDFCQNLEIVTMINNILESLEIIDVEAQMKIIKHLKSKHKPKHEAISEQDDEDSSLENDDLYEENINNNDFSIKRIEGRRQILGSLKEINLNQLGSQRDCLEIENLELDDSILVNLDLKQIKSKFETLLIKLYNIEKTRKDKDQNNVLREINKTDQKIEQNKLIKLEIQRKAEISEKHKNGMRANSRMQTTVNKELNQKKIKYEKAKSFK